MLTPAIHRAYVAGVRALAGNGKARLVMRGAESLGPNQGQAHLFVARAEDFLADPRLQEEVFGAASLVVQCGSDEALRDVAERLEGQLTATLHLDEADLPPRGRWCRR